jgi:hypothetical protein
VADQLHESWPPGRSPGAGHVSNEFASVRVEIDYSRNSPVLRLTDTETGDTVWLDALELQTVIRSDPGAFTAYPPGWPPDTSHLAATQPAHLEEPYEGSTAQCPTSQQPATR